MKVSNSQASKTSSDSLNRQKCLEDDLTFSVKTGRIEKSKLPSRLDRSTVNLLRAADQARLDHNSYCMHGQPKKLSRESLADRLKNLQDGLENITGKNIEKSTYNNPTMHSEGEEKIINDLHNTLFECGWTPPEPDET